MLAPMKDAEICDEEDEEEFFDFETEHESRLEERMKHISDTFSQYLMYLIREKKMENASKQYTYDKVKKMVEKKKKKHHWEFVFLGANIDAIEVAGRFGVAANRAVRYECDSAGTALNFDVMSKLVSRARACDSADEMEECFDDKEMLAPIQEDYKKRHKA